MMRLSRPNHVPGCFETFSTIFRRVYHSFGYGLLYGVVLLLNAVMIIWLILHEGEPQPLRLFILVEAIVTLALDLEVVYTVKTLGCRKWVVDISNWFDFLVAVVCTLSLFAYIGGKQELQGSVAVAVSSVRYSAQALRLCILLRHARRKNAEGITEFEQVRFDVNFDSVELANLSSESKVTSPRLEYSPKDGHYWGRGRAFSASPIFMNPKRSSAVHLDHTIKVQEVPRNQSTSPLPLSRNSSASNSVISLPRLFDEQKNGNSWSPDSKLSATEEKDSLLYN